MDNLNPGIRKTVELLQGWGYQTIDSGDGVTHDFECDRDHAYVVIQLTDQEDLVAQADELVKRFEKSFGIEFGPVGFDKPCLQASYDPYNRFVFLDLMNVDDSLLQKTDDFD